MRGASKVCNFWLSPRYLVKCLLTVKIAEFVINFSRKYCLLELITFALFDYIRKRCANYYKIWDTFVQFHKLFTLSLNAAVSCNLFTFLAVRCIQEIIWSWGEKISFSRQNSAFSQVDLRQVCNIVTFCMLLIYFAARNKFAGAILCHCWRQTLLIVDQLCSKIAAWLHFIHSVSRERARKRDAATLCA